MSYISNGKQLSDGNPDGTIMGQSATDTISFFGVTPIAQRTSSAQSALTLTTVVQTGAYGLATTTGMSALLAQVEEIRATLVALGLMKGS